MEPAGREAIARSKKEGLWNFLDDVDALIRPTDLQKALDAKPEAKAFFDQLGPASQRFALRWIKLAKTEKTRQKRIRDTVTLSAKGEKVPGS